VSASSRARGVGNRLDDEHANWQEKGLIEQIRSRFTLPLTTYAVDPHGHG
jgi:hypothetical protein